MLVTAPTLARTGATSKHQTEGRAQADAAASTAAVSAFLESPDDPKRLLAFLEALERLDPASPRSGALEAALAAALSKPDLDGRVIDRFVQNTLEAELGAQWTANDDVLHLPTDTLCLIAAFLHHRRNRSIMLESVLIRVRQELLELAKDQEAPGPIQLQLAEAMARQSFINEYIWDEPDADSRPVAKLTAKVSQSIETGAQISAFELFVIGAYRPLDTIPAIRDWVVQLGQSDAGALDPTLQMLVFDRFQEDGLQIEVLTPITSSTSVKVRSQYERNPYPRWRHLPAKRAFSNLGDYVSASTGHYLTGLDAGPRNPQVLIAGAGTGQHPLSVARSLPTAAILAVDLSRNSLAYATREGQARGLANVAFAQADILQLAGAKVEFDLVESVGVLHHMEDPEAGLTALVSVLRPGGYLKLGLYSRAARGSINAARDLCAASPRTEDLDGLRSFRRDLIASTDPAIERLRAYSDFYTSSEFRDCVMHVQEHQFTLPQIASLLARNGLKFLGFSTPRATSALGQMPEKMTTRKARDLKFWKSHEDRSPDTFIGMYEFFCRKR